jgi:4-hydroxythreonine-4-phosphate dehydrogenase
MKLLGISIGDPNGIGPEIAIKTVLDRSLKKKCHIVLIGDLRILRETAKKVGIRCAFVPFDNFATSGIQVIGPDPIVPTKIRWGEITSSAGRASLSYVYTGGLLALKKKIDALVTAPISKESVIRSGQKNFTGHTEYLAELTDTKEFALALWHGAYRVAHVSCHVSLREAIVACRKERIVQVGKFLHRAIKSEGVKDPVIGIAGLNPHAGEAGAYGREEAREIIPAVKQLRRSGINAVGPVPPDIVFARMKGGVYDGVVAMYHDQGHIATKTLFFSLDKKGKASVHGVNVTLGLKIIRTSCDHGTSFDIAGKGSADYTSLKEAVELAVKLSGHCN